MKSKLITFLIAFLTLFSCSKNEGKKSKETVTAKVSMQSFGNIDFKKVTVKGSKLVLNSKTSFETKLYDLSCIGTLKTKNKLPYFIFSGRSCIECDENISIYVWSPSDAAFEPTSHPWKFSYPGKDTDYESNQLVFESAMYFGTCLGNESCIWVQKQRTKAQLWKKSIFILSVKNDYLTETSVTKASEIEHLESKLSECTELPGRDITSEP
ncbi:hypothetical protein [Flavobacterium sp.]|uniref:hypothetical protein n=1 Tax=Flavobacterium sp. TaxID=239 RepID=UPI003B9A9F0F